MKKCLLLLCLTTLIIPVISQAQNQPSAAYLKTLIQNNAARIGIAQNDLSNWRVADAHYDKNANAMFVYLQQTYLGVDIDGAVNSISFKNEKFITGSLYAIKDLQSSNKNAAPSIDAKSALINAAQSAGLQIKTPVITLKTFAESNTYQFDKLGISYNEIPVKLQWHRTADNNQLQLAWQVIISSDINNALWNINVDAVTGKILDKTNLTVYEQANNNVQKPHRIFVYEDDQQQKNMQTSVQNVQDVKSINSSKYNVIAYPNESPLVASPSLETDPWTINHDQNANTLKWNSDGTTDFKNLQGNNIFVQLDLDSNNNTPGYSPSSTTNAPDLTFNFPFIENSSPTEDPEFGETNLFYWNNLMHDLSYQYGFNEAAGNFQQNNLGRGGSDKDFVYADAQDGGGNGTHIDNANFATPSDGSNPRQQMYLWYPSILKGFFVNSPNNFKGGKPAQESNVSGNNKIKAKGPITNDIVIYKDALFPDSSNACGAPSNKAELAGKIAYIDRGSCNFTVKFLNAQSAGAKAILVGNVSATDPRYTDGTGGNRLLTMSATPLDNTITIPGFFIQYDTAKKIKAFGSGNVNTTLAYSPFIDGEIDNTIPTHEYTHGISNRLVGGRTNVSCLQNAEQMGEGWSDWYAIMITQNWANSTASGDHIRAIGNYAAGVDTNYTGIRVYPYSTNFDYDPWTYDSLKALKGSIFNPADPHTIGEMWTTMLWDMTWRLVKDYGISNNIFDATGKGGNNIALTLVTQGLKLTKCSPGSADGRDGILKADTLLFSGKYSADIWKAFAIRGLGYSASQGASNNTNDGIPAYDLPPSILPVTISEFTAQKQGNTALLKWTTAQESNTDKFIAERSEDGKVFASVGEVKAAGNSSVQKYYQLTDATPLKGNNIYRIKEIDKDGKSNLSDIRSLNFADVKPYIKISPNPANNIVTVNIPGNSQNLTLRLLSNTGQLIGNYVMNSESYKIDVSKLAAGVYNILIDGNGYSTKYKLVIQ